MEIQNNKGIAFFKDNYDVEYMLDFETILEDSQILCRKNGGTLKKEPAKSESDNTFSQVLFSH